MRGWGLSSHSAPYLGKTVSMYPLKFEILKIIRRQRVFVDFSILFSFWLLYSGSNEEHVGSYVAIKTTKMRIFVRITHVQFFLLARCPHISSNISLFQRKRKKRTLKIYVWIQIWCF